MVDKLKFFPLLTSIFLFQFAITLLSCAARALRQFALECIRRLRLLPERRRTLFPIFLIVILNANTHSIELKSRLKVSHLITLLMPIKKNYRMRHLLNK